MQVALRVVLGALAIAGSMTVCARPTAKAPGAAPPSADSVACAGDNGGLFLSPGFCATVFADDVGHARHIVVSPSGVVYVNTWSGEYYGNDTPPAGGFLVALEDTHNSGKADVVERFGDGVAQGSSGGTGIALYKNFVYAEVNDRIVRYALDTQDIAPAAAPEIVVTGLPLSGDHPMHPFIIDANGSLFVDLGSATNACEEQNRVPLSKGRQPCVEKETRGGIWRYDANQLDQKFSPAERYATGIRNGEGMAFDSAGRLFVTQHGRDQLAQVWNAYYTIKRGALLPAEELVELKEGADYGWPECYFDGFQKKLMLAPEYGGDGKKTGLCKGRTPPAAYFPAHWAPNALLMVSNPKFPANYRQGAFIAFHGSWNRAPAPQGGYNVVFQPLAGGKTSGAYVVFADGFAGAIKEPGAAKFRPSGLAVGPDAALYVTDDMHGRIWRITYKGTGEPAVAAAPVVKSQREMTGSVMPPEGIHPDAGRQTASLPLPPGATRAQLTLGDRIFHGAARQGSCAGCHGSDAQGSPVGADLTSGTYLWSDGSVAGLAKTITRGVVNPKQHGGAMPPKGGSPLSPADVKAVAVYVWALGHAENK